MHTHRIRGRSKDHALLDRAVLNLMLDPERQRPWSESELARAVRGPGDVRESLGRLHADKLVHRWDDLAVATHAAVRFHEIGQGGENLTSGEREERHWERAILEWLTVHTAEGEGSRSLQETCEALGATAREKRLAITDALDRLEGAGLIERRSGRSIASEVARRLDELMTV